MFSQYKRLTKVLAKSLNLDEESFENSFCLASLEDIPTVSALRRKVFGDIIKKDDERYLEWRYFGRSEFPSTLLLFKYNNRIIAAVGTEPVELFNQGKIEPAIRSMDAIVDPKFNNRGLGAWMNLALQSQNTCILTTGGNENSTSMLKKLFTAIPARKNFKIIIHSRNFLDHKFRSFLNVLVSPLIDVVANFYLNIKWSSKLVDKKQALTYFQDIDQMLQKTVDPIDCLAEIKVLRSKPYLKWRYADNPRINYFSVGIIAEDKLMAYVIYSLKKRNRKGSISVGQIVDWSINLQTESLKMLTSLFVATIRDLKQRGADEIIMVLNDALSNQAATAAGFVFRDVESSLYVYHAKASKNSRFYSADAWYQSLGDSDM